MKKKFFWIITACLLCVFFTSCKSAPKEEPVEEPAVVTPVPEPVEEKVPEPEPVVVEDFSEENKALLAKVTEARLRALDAGANVTLPSELQKIDDYAKEIESEFSKSGNSKEFTSKAKNLDRKSVV